ncbi:MAG: alpha/beta hydrolase [Bauldia sp.]|nr:alpha/beta hydrolase [Bauldia sp.]
MEEIASARPGGAHETALSADGTPIAFDRRGSGETLILIGGALNDRHSAIAGLPMAGLLADAFTVVSFDRRGRGQSGDTLPYAPRREVEDVAALAAAVGGPARLFGHSSGGGLALLAAASGLFPVAGVAVYEPPYNFDEASVDESRTFTATLRRLAAEGKRGDAVALFLEGVGMPKEMIAGMRGAPHWPAFEKMAETLVYDAEIMLGSPDGMVPVTAIATIAAPVLAMAGGESPDFMRTAGRTIAAAAKNGRYLELEGQGHDVPAAWVARELKAFFPPDT